MNQEQRQAYEWAKSQNYQSVAARYAKVLAGLVDEMTPPNEPLTLDELREMDGEPVWVEEVKHWALIDIEKSGQWAGIPFAVWAENGANFTYNIEGRKLHCFRRPPEG